jgi:hypothetical protein
MSLLPIFKKDPLADEDFGFDWSEFLTEGETITEFEVFVPDGLTQPKAASVVAGIVVVWLGGGVAYQTYDVGCSITTNFQPRLDKRSITIDCTPR